MKCSNTRETCKSSNPLLPPLVDVASLLSIPAALVHVSLLSSLENNMWLFSQKTDEENFTEPLKEYKRTVTSLLEITFNLTEKSVHLHIFLLIKLFSNPGKTRKHYIYKPVRPNLWRKQNAVKKSYKTPWFSVNRGKKNSQTPTCGTSSSWVTLTKFSNMATIEGAAITWQLTKSDRKRTYNKQKMYEMKNCTTHHQRCL